MILPLILFQLNIIFSNISRNVNNDISQESTIIAKVLDYDPVVQKLDSEYYTRIGERYYYGVHHIKVVLVDVANYNKLSDTLILAYVYNNFTERELYKKNFNLERNKIYAFYLNELIPCSSDFPRLQGNCDVEKNIFYPESNHLIKEYSFIQRIIYAFDFKLER